MKKQIVALAMLLMLSSASVLAVDVQLHGFGTAGVAKSDSKFSVNDIGNEGPRPTFARDSRFGLNVSAKLSDRWDISSQFITKANSFEPITAQFFFIRLHASSQFNIRAGRMIAPTWLLSEQIEVGLTYPWVRLPYEVYILNPLRFFDGLSVAWTQQMGDWSLGIEVMGGSSTYKDKSFDDSKISYVNMPETFGGNVTLSDDKHVLLRASYVNALINGTANALVAASTIYPSMPIGSITVPSTLFNSERGQLISIGGKFDIGNFLVMTEAARRIITGNYLAVANSAYLTVGYHVGELMPFASGSWLGNLLGTGWPDPDPATIATATTSLSPLDNQYTLSGGVNYRVSPSVVWKLQYDYVRTNNTNAVMSKNAQVVSTSLDFVF
ncbi:MAG: hypothetical protein KA715_12310 [Xanthomonadaceae bacterium]|nr:hypothetical protein [Xanthomonadaceae bacterium]